MGVNIFIIMAGIYKVNQLIPILKKDRRVVFTHGAFDLFHPGHFYLLENSSALGGRLVVGVESDESIAVYKKRKPIFREGYRMKLIS